MKKLLYTLLLTAVLTGCGNKEEAIKTATEWTQDNILRFYTNPRIEEVEYKYCVYDEHKLYAKSVYITVAQSDQSKSDYEYSKKYGINSRSDEETNIMDLKKILLACEESAYKKILTGTNYIEALIYFTYEKKEAGRGHEYFTVVMTANTLQVLNRLIKQEKCEECKEWGQENRYQYTIIEN